MTVRPSELVARHAAYNIVADRRGTPASGLSFAPGTVPQALRFDGTGLMADSANLNIAGGIAGIL